MIIAGVDYSITCPAITIFDDSKEFCFGNTKTFYFQGSVSKKEQKRRNSLGVDNIFHGYQESEYSCETERFYNLAKSCFDVIKDNRVEKVIMEAYALGGTGKVFNIAEATGIFKFLLFREGIPFELYPPTVIKKTFKGNGSGKKEMMLQKFEEMNGINLNSILGFKRKDLTASPISDIVDSYAIVYTYLKMETR